jgi:hypothetical protein
VREAVVGPVLTDIRAVVQAKKEKLRSSLGLRDQGGPMRRWLLN